MIVFLIGMPACGKTTIGKRLAKKLQFTFLDLDNHLVDKENSSVSKIFSEKGETFFRELEHKYLTEISATNTNCIVSTGGGTPCFHNNVVFMKSAGKVIYIKPEPETLFLRLKQDNKRPLFAGLSEIEVKEKLFFLLQQREKFYLQAHYQINTQYKSDIAIVEEISKLIKVGN